MYICLSVYNTVQPNEYTSDYKSHLTKLQILPLMYILELNNIISFIRNFKFPHEGFNINSYISFASGDTIVQQPTANYNIIDHPPMQLTIFTLISYLNSAWNALPVIDPALDTKVIKYKLTQYLWCNFNPDSIPALIPSFASTPNAANCPLAINNYNTISINSYNFVISN